MGTCFGEEKSGFPVHPEVKIRKNRFFEVHVEQASITHLITALFVTFHTFFSHMCAQTAEYFHDIMNLAITAFEKT